MEFEDVDSGLFNGLTVHAPARHGLSSLTGKNIVREKCRFHPGLNQLVRISDSHSRERTLLLSFPEAWTAQDIQAAVYLVNQAYRMGRESGAEELRSQFAALLELKRDE